MKNKNEYKVHSEELHERISYALRHSFWVLRVTEHKEKPIPVLIVKERFTPDKDSADTNYLKDRGLIYGQSLRRCIPIIRMIVAGVCDQAGIPLELQNFFARDRILYRGNLPLGDEAGAKLALLFKLQERIRDIDRVELIAWRVQRFSREEAAYWLSRVTQYGAAGNRWAQSGMRVLLGGNPGDKSIIEMLEKLRK